MSGCGEGCACSSCSGDATPSSAAALADPIAYRHSAIKKRLLERISKTTIDETQPLSKLGTREDDDPTIAVLDAFAGSLHVLAWNIARIYDDGMLSRTEDQSALVRLTRLLGYVPRPAISATTTLTFSLDERDGSPRIVKIPKRTKVASIPGKDEQPQMFETDAELEARVEWNSFEPTRVANKPTINNGTDTITIKGQASPVKAGDLVLVYPGKTAGKWSEKWLVARVERVTRGPNAPEPNTPPVPPQTLLRLASRSMLACSADFQGAKFENKVIVLGQRAAIFGATAPDFDALKKQLIAAGDPIAIASKATDWSLVAAVANPNGSWSVDLDAVYPDAMSGRFVLFSTLGEPSSTSLMRIESVTEGARADFGLAAKVSRIVVEGSDLSGKTFGDVRKTAVYLESAAEALLVPDLDQDLPLPPSKNSITVQGAVQLPVGRRLVLQGRPSSGEAATLAEVATLLSLTTKKDGDSATTKLEFAQPLVNQFKSATLKLYGNCVLASHGETPAQGAEQIGSGNASTENPRFPMKARPLAHVPAPGPRGYKPALEVRVGPLLYGEGSSIFKLGSADHAYTVRSRPDGTADVQFAGRLPTGSRNVSALYRNGGGRAGNLDAGRLTALLMPVLGVRGVQNPVSAEGGSDPETLDETRELAPKSIRTLDRVVSLGDFEAFAQGYRGIGKALASELHAGMRRVVCLTVATTELLPPTAGSEIVSDLRNALQALAVPGVSVRIEGFIDLAVTFTVYLAVDPAYLKRDVHEAVRSALGRDFGRPVRRFAEALHESALVASIQRVPGVIALRVTDLQSPNGGVDDVKRLPCPAPALNDGTFTPAGLLSVTPDHVTFKELPP